MKQTERYIVAIDPGKDKAGMALVRFDGQAVERLIAPPQDVVERVRAWQTAYPVAAVVLGDRTGSRAFQANLRAAGIAVETVDEHLSTQEAQRRYVADHPGRGLARWLPASLRTPDRPVDDYVAVILAERYLERRLEQERNHHPDPRA